MSLSTIPLLGYAPDLDPTQPGVFSYCKGMEASAYGWKLQRSLLAVATSTSGDPTDGFIYKNTTSGVLNEFPNVVQGSTIYINTGGQTVGSGYTATDLFSFAQYGKYILLARRSQTAATLRNVQVRDGTNNTDQFADISATAIPKAAIVVVWGPPTSPRVMLLNYDDGTVYSDGWWTSHQGGYTLSWTPDIATGAANGRLLGAGQIRCGIAYGDDIIVFGENSMWRGVFVGPPYTVQWQKISNDVGALGHGAAVVINGILYVLSTNGLFMYDGTYPRKMPVPIQSELGEVARVAGYRSKLASDLIGQRLIVVLRGNGAAAAAIAASKVYLINLLNNKVGIDGRGSWLVLDSQWYVSPSGIQQETSASIANNGTPYPASLSESFGIGLHRIGANKGDTKILGVYPRFITAPSTYSWNDYFGPTASEALGSNTGATTISATPWRADFLKSARWHAPRLLFSSNGTVDVEIADVMINSEPAGNQ